MMEHNNNKQNQLNLACVNAFLSRSLVGIRHPINNKQHIQSDQENLSIKGQRKSRLKNI